MSGFKESFWENNDTFNVNFTPRSDQTALEVICSRNRPCSAADSCKSKVGNKIKCSRPKSAEFSRQIPIQIGSLGWSVIPGKNKFEADSPITVSRFTDSSSKLLQNLLETTNQKMQILEGKHYVSEIQDTFSRGKVISVKENPPEIVEEKTVRFCEGEQLELLSEKESAEKYTCLRNDESFSSCLKIKFKTSCQETNQISEKKCNQEKEFKSPATVDLNDKSESIAAKIYNSDAETETSSGKNEGEILLEKWCRCLKDKKANNEFERTVGNSLLAVEENFEMNTCPHSEKKSSEKFERLTLSSDEEIEECNRRFEEVEQVNTKLDCVNQKTAEMDSTYEEIVRLLQTLDEEDSESVNLENKQDLPVENPAASSDDKIHYFGAVSSYLEEVERDANNFHDNVKNENYSSEHFISPKLDQLLNKSSVELAHEVFSLKIQIEDQKKGIKLLKDTLGEMKEAKKIEELEHQEALQKAGAEAEALVQRHQKFIKQLLNEKKNLNETVSRLVQDLKLGEEKYKRNLKAIEEKHAVEIKRAKEAQAVADKIKREKWMENKTQKIKEMTVKGLEPELSRMAARQQEELTELRNLHKAELEAVELRAARRTSELMDELRAELTKEKERAVSKETATLRSNMEKDFEDEKNKLQQYCQTLKDRIRKQEEKLSNQEFEFQQRLLDCRQEEEKKRQKVIRENQENLEELRRQHLVEIRNLKASAESEKEVALNNYKKLQAVKFSEREAELHQQYKKKRDREIEIVIETLEKESTQAQVELNIANEGKLKRLKDNMKAEITEIEASEAILKEKLSEAKSKLSEKEDIITELSSNLRQQQTELNFLKKSCEEMGKEKAKMKEIIYEEFKSNMNDLAKEKEYLEREIVVLKELHLKELAKKDEAWVQAKFEMQKELTKVYSRIKSAVNKKEKIIESLREEIEATNKKCHQLEFMLDQQRRNLLLQ